MVMAARLRNTDITIDFRLRLFLRTCLVLSRKMKT